ncbi:Sodium/calcium exchanger protein-domain-containing protein [Geopyxis carbonaria]|nr:Sodium/calcium exchanger protein-domain-containing protein [Geopyxis carbonaria]
MRRRPLLLLLMAALAACAAAIRLQPEARYSPANTFLGLPTVQRRNNWMLQREEKRLRPRELDCTAVHHAKDKCKFVRKHCLDEKVGLLDYLELYYCRLGHVKGVAFGIIALWLVVLFSTIGIAASDFFCVNLSTIASILGMSESMAGVTFLAFGNGSPDVFSTFAAMKINSGSLAVGELIGAASFITAVVAGSMAIVRPFKVGRKSFVRDVSFFAVAVLFGLFFLADGKIQMWECVVMILFYIFYVVFVIGWHWMAGRKKRRRRKERRAREHHTAPEDEELLVADEDDEDGGVGVNENDDLMHDFGALERAETDSEAREDDEDDREEQSAREFAELSNNMRITRPALDRKLTPTTPHSIRPSLVGALEFRAVLSSLERSKNQQGPQIHLRRYSDDPFLATISHQPAVLDALEDLDGGAHYPRHTASTLLAPGRISRDRAVSMNDAHGSRVDPSNFPPLPDLLISSDQEESDTDDRDSIHKRPARPDLSSLLIPSGHTSPSQSPNSSAPVSPMSGGVPLLIVPDGSPTGSPRRQSPRGSPRPQSTRASRPPSIRLPRPSLDSASTALLTPGEPWKRIHYWPYDVLPPPQLIFETCFPTLRGFWDKSFLEKLLALAAVPSVFLLTITLPVVEADAKPEAGAASALPPDSPTSFLSATTLAAPTPRLDPAAPATPPPTWNRWLVAVQCITAPLFIVLMLFTDFSHSLLRPVLYALLTGLLTLLLLLLTTSPTTPPRHRYLLCFAGFVVSISWISSVAEEVVGVLKAFGVIFGISDAILGLTIFAVGNSLGDLVADITVARLGFPVMALSACFGGPMLNILLGVGISGLYMTVTRGGPERRPYLIEVSSTLVISAATLLVTLVVLLVWVPLNGWMMSRRIGWTIVALWAVSTVVNVAVEVTGVGTKWGGDGGDEM